MPPPSPELQEVIPQRDNASRANIFFRWVFQPFLRSFMSPSGPAPPSSYQENNNALIPRTFSGLGMPCFQCFVQDNDPRILYTGQWKLNQFKAFTTHSSAVSGSMASLTFNGTGITVFGTVSASNATVKPPTVVYQVNAAPPFTTTQPFASQDVFNQPLFSLTLGTEWAENKITIRVIDAEAPFVLDSFFIFPANMTMDSNSTAMGNAKASPTSTGASNETKPSLSSPGSISKESGSQSTIRVLAGLLGVTLLLVLAMAVFIVLHCLRQRRRTRPKPRPETTYTHFTGTDTIFPPSLNWTGSLSRSDGMRSVYGRGLSDHIQAEATEVPPVPPKIPFRRNTLTYA
ncbi:hypothetical protein NP233_g7326 [Leucocoprinus birnbaumii]|uniref:Uncharacterized protein n=1 Tax=Leucocoprinus birnbaumii TaxID=56174 RepID=A0AAD5YUV0_9AGAR|nr:hypothetical protein NP233_g7326 [Leucocoprinus birnbaumii]